MALRRRPFAFRRLTLLVAAAVGISLLGIGGALSGLFNPTLPVPTHVALASSNPVATSTGPGSLPGLDELVAVDPASVLIAQAHGPNDAPPNSLPADAVAALPRVDLGVFNPSSDYQLSIGCLGAGSIVLDIRAPGSFGPIAPTGPSFPCDGAMYDDALVFTQARSLSLSLTGYASWRVVLRGPTFFTQSTQVATIPDAPEGQQELVRWDQQAMDPGAQAWGTAGLIAQEVGGISVRRGYTVNALCNGASPIRVIFGGAVSGLLEASTETLIACDPSIVRGAFVGIPDPGASEVWVAAKPDQQVSLVVTSEAPPFALAQSRPGWQLSGGIGPDYQFSTTGEGFSGAGVEGGGPVLVAFSCTGTKPIEVHVDVGKVFGKHIEKFTADCSPEGTTTEQTFTAASFVSVDYVHPAGTWAALTILIRSP